MYKCVWRNRLFLAYTVLKRIAFVAAMVQYLYLSQGNIFVDVQGDNICSCLRKEAIFEPVPGDHFCTYPII